MALFERKQPVEYLIVGLGNPGREYERTRHNVGFMALDYIAGRIGADIRDLKQMALTGRGVLEGRRVLLVKPADVYESLGRVCRRAAALLQAHARPTDRCLRRRVDGARQVARAPQRLRRRPQRRQKHH